MNLAKAIEIGTLFVQDGEVNDLHDLNEAVKLLAQAGKNIQAVRRGWLGSLYDPLPGETA